ncbi:MAG: PstS family phosphate ABC transporter substrate-binding protein [Candidatus Nanopelagicales bacterium]|nr:PstS family phosphate ABC transporter substrate-binding protein [Candidatus Nanopelagicales bacterium]MDP4715179.1 PstS family phosphate ABC transporter substrate-binding protein [Candidatus Nanopelagicales bacterium]MDP4907614.1 PstS family phosphate ABC transporter substrate-binding protein [Candidatus Nanopelagicales bacterium]MDP4975293.1 PstS family phosphate ABC transporter substrate-binding protein [Candidatus Nanopelagicales bacterium]MDP5095519.1 PstS family phosphate ABC transporte
MTRTRGAAIAATTIAGALLLAACGGSSSSDSSSASSDLTGSILIDGSSTVGPATEIAAELFMAQNPGVAVTVAVSGTSGGFEKFCLGETDGNDASRLIKEEEIIKCDEAGITYDNITVANDALTVLVNAAAPVECLTVAQLNAIWGDGSTISTWGEIPDLDVPADFASTPLALYGPGTDSGTFDFFTEAINGEEGSIRIDYTSIGEDDNAAVTAVTGDVGAMGYVPFSFYQEAGDAVKGIAVDGGNGCAEPTAENVQDGSYSPLGRALYVYASGTALQKPETVAFFDFYINNSAQIAEIGGYIGLTPAQVTEQLAKVASLAGQ